MDLNQRFYSNFTDRFPVSKTLRFEIIPQGQTLERMRQVKTFLVDQEIEDAYQSIKPVFDIIHDKFITLSLESKSAKAIDFSQYFNLYQQKKLKFNELRIAEKKLRQLFDGIYLDAGEQFREIVGKNNKNEYILTKTSYKILTEKGILKFIEKNLSDFKDIISTTELEHSIKIFKNFFTYLSEFNQSRENYYITNDKANVSIATRVINENLPKYCDNIVFYDTNKQIYEQVYSELLNRNKLPLGKKNINLTSIDDSIFNIGYFNECLSQKQIENYNNKINSYNFLINLYNQQEVNKKRKKLPFFKTLYKQIGGIGDKNEHFNVIKYDKNKPSDNTKKENNMESLEGVLELAYLEMKEFNINNSNNKLSFSILDFIKYIISRDNYTGIYLNKIALNTISQKYFKSWNVLTDLLVDAKIIKKNNYVNNEVKLPNALELKDLFYVIDLISDWKTRLFKENISNDNDKKEIFINSSKPSEVLIELILSDLKQHINEFLLGFNEISKIKDYKSENSKILIKSWMDHQLAVKRIIKYFDVKERDITGEPLDSTVSQFLMLFLYNENTQNWYDLIRNYLTKKPQDEAQKNKLRLNFNNGVLLEGWTDGQEKSKSAVILKKDNEYFVGILKKRNLFDTSNENNPIYINPNLKSGRLILSNLPFKTLAGKGFLSKFGQNYGEMGKSDPFKAIKNLQALIKENYLSKYPLLEGVLTKDYSDKKIFDMEVKELLTNSYSCEFKPINWDEVQNNIALGNLYLFKIHSKGIGNYKNNLNLQSLYWNALFEENSKFQLNGGAKIFYRKAAINDKKIKRGYEKKPYVIENKRFTVEKFLFHCPITINYNSPKLSNKGASSFNTYINTIFSKFNKTYFLGIDRGEKNLAYYCLIDNKANIIAQDSLNLPFIDKNGNNRTIKVKVNKVDSNGNLQEEEIICHDYNDLLEARSKNRDYSRKNWQAIQSIKELKEGYISQVIKQIVDIAIAKNALIVLEDLNTGFKRGRQKIEKSVYQKFELALSQKLNYIVNKKASCNEIGSVNNGVQLTPLIKTYNDIENKKQIGILLYTRANYTSQTDPITGWRKTIYIKSGSEAFIKEQILNLFIEIGFDGNNYFFEYKDKFATRWIMYSGQNGASLDRFYSQRGEYNKWEVKKIDLNNLFAKIFQNFDKNISLKKQLKDGIKIEKITTMSNKSGLESLRFAINLLQQIRNTGIDKRDNDFILSPVRDYNGNHFDSRIATPYQPINGDSNGAYNIARKGLIMYKHIKQGKQGKDLDITDDEWDNWLHGQIS